MRATKSVHNIRASMLRESAYSKPSTATVIGLRVLSMIAQGRPENRGKDHSCVPLTKTLKAGHTKAMKEVTTMTQTMNDLGDETAGIVTQGQREIHLIVVRRMTRIMVIHGGRTGLLRPTTNR